MEALAVVAERPDLVMRLFGGETARMENDKFVSIGLGLG